jgi:aspartate 1-decarboxylase
LTFSDSPNMIENNFRSWRNQNMFIHLMKSKIHCARISEANLHYVGSITIDKKLMEAANIVENEKVQVVNNTNGQRFETYVIEGKYGQGDICLNGASARLVYPGDIVIIISYGIFTKEEVSEFKPSIIFVDDQNQIKCISRQEQHGM